MIPVIAASTVSANEAHAKRYLTVEQAQKLIFPGAKLTPADFSITNQQADRLAKISGTTVYRNQIKMWRSSTGGYFILDQVPGRDDRITYAVGLNPDGTVKGVEVLECLAEYDQVRGNWRKLFYGKRFRNVHLSKEISNISGTTLSVQHLTDGITRILATYALFIASN